MKIITKEENICRSRFEDIHNKILNIRDKIKQCLYELCSALKEMHDSKAYLTAGYKSFEEYTYDCFGIKKSQAYDYVKIANKYSLDFFDEYGDLGITKLQALNKLSASDAEDFLDTYKVDSMSVKQIKKAVDEYINHDMDDDIDYDYYEDQQEELIIDFAKPEINITSFASFLKSKRTAKGISLCELSRLCNINSGTLHHIENGNRQPSEKLIEKIKEILDLSSDDIKLMNQMIDKLNMEKRRIPADVLEYLLNNPHLINKLRQDALRR